MGRLVTQQGFTLVELMMTIFIAAILMAIAVPGFQTLRQNSQQRSAIADLSATLARARTEVGARHRSVTICASSDQATCSGEVAWENGWIVFVDMDGDGAFDVGNDVMIMVHSSFPNGATIRMLGALTTRVTYDRDGLLAAPVTFRYCDARGLSSLRAIVVNESGSIRQDKDSKDHTGAVITACAT